MKFLKDIILEKLIITKDTKEKNHPLSKEEWDLLQRIFKFYIECFLSNTSVYDISTKNEVDDERYDYTIDEIIDIISGAKRENRSVRSILFNNEFKSNQNKEIIGKLEELFNKIKDNRSKSFINKIKEEFLKAINDVIDENGPWK